MVIAYFPGGALYDVERPVGDITNTDIRTHWACSRPGEQEAVMSTISKARTGDGIRGVRRGQWRCLYTCTCLAREVSIVDVLTYYTCHNINIAQPHAPLTSPLYFLHSIHSSPSNNAFQCHYRENFHFEGTRLPDDKSYWLIFCEQISGYSWSRPGGVSMIVITYQNGISMFALSSQYGAPSANTIQTSMAHQHHLLWPRELF